jgi:hypothetical protein
MSETKFHTHREHTKWNISNYCSRKGVKSMFTCRQSFLPISGSLVKKEKKAQKGYQA